MEPVNAVMIFHKLETHSLHFSVDYLSFGEKPLPCAIRVILLWMFHIVKMISLLGG